MDQFALLGTSLSADEPLPASARRGTVAEYEYMHSIITWQRTSRHSIRHIYTTPESTETVYGEQRDAHGARINVPQGRTSGVSLHVDQVIPESSAEAALGDEADSHGHHHRASADSAEMMRGWVKPRASKSQMIVSRALSFSK